MTKSTKHCMAVLVIAMAAALSARSSGATPAAPAPTAPVLVHAPQRALSAPAHDATGSAPSTTSPGADLETATAPTPPSPSSPSSGHAGIISSDDMGVTYCRLFVNGSAFGKELDYPGLFMLHVFLRYTSFQGSVKLKGAASAEPTAERRPPGPPPAPGGGSAAAAADLQLDPQLLLLPSGDSDSDAGRSGSLKLTGTIIFPIAPVTIAAATSPVFLKFALPPGSTQQYRLTSLGANSSCSFNPTQAPNKLSARGVEVPIVKDVATEVTEAHVVMSPFFGMHQGGGRMEAFALLLDRHIQWHGALGFQQHVIYMREEDALRFSKLPAVSRWLGRGQLLLVVWKSIPRHPRLPYYDQRMVYSHAILAFTGLNASLAMLDLDEYIIPMREELRTIQDMSWVCNSNGSHAPPQPRKQRHPRQLTAGPAAAAPLPLGTASAPGRPGDVPRMEGRALSAPASPQPPNLQITRYHSVAGQGSSSSHSSELEMWAAAAAAADHPLLRYSLVNRLRPPAVKSIVRPEFIRTYNIHYASAYNAFGSTALAPDCLFILHLKNLLGNRGPTDLNSSLRRLGFSEDLLLEKALKARASRLGGPRSS